MTILQLISVLTSLFARQCGCVFKSLWRFLKQQLVKNSHIYSYGPLYVGLQETCVRARAVNFIPTIVVFLLIYLSQWWQTYMSYLPNLLDNAISFLCFMIKRCCMPHGRVDWWVEFIWQDNVRLFVYMRTCWDKFEA